MEIQIGGIIVRVRTQSDENNKVIGHNLLTRNEEPTFQIGDQLVGVGLNSSLKVKLECFK